MNFNIGVGIFHKASESVGNVVSSTDTDVTFRTRSGLEATCPKSECQTLKGRPRKMTAPDAAPAA